MKINRFAREQNRNRSWLAVLGILAMLVGGLFPGSVFAAAPASAQVVVPEPGPALTVNIVAVNDGAGGQTDPHLSGDWVSYTDSSVNGIRFQNLDLDAATDRLIPRPDGAYDSLSDISGTTIVFLRTSGSYQGIDLVQIDPFGNPGSASEVSPVAGALRSRAAIGGDTIAYEDRTYGGSSAAPAEISLSSALDPSAPAYRLTDDALADQLPAVSPDGNTVVWIKCTSATACDVWRAERTSGVWGAPEQVTGAAGNESFPDTNGVVAVYGSTAGGDDNIRWSVKDSSGAYVESVLELPGIQRNPYIAGNFIVFESNAAPGTPYDIWLYDLETNYLHQLTDTPVSETLSDISIGYRDVIRVTWAQPKEVYPYDMDVYALSVVPAVEDTTAPAITPTISGTLGANGWYTSDVSLTWSVSDAESAISSTSGCDAMSVTQDQAATDYTCSATSAGGTALLTVSIARDASAPVITCPDPQLIPGSGVQTVTAGVDAAISGLDEAASVLSGTLSGDEPQTLTFTAVDLAGNTATKECTFNPVYNFTGFFDPVKNPPRVNALKAGAAVPLKFSLGGDQGLDIFADGFPTSQPVSCTNLKSSSGPVLTVVAGSSSLSYDPITDQYTYVWKTDKKWAGKCRVLTVQLDDGTPHLAYFQFK